MALIVIEGLDRVGKSTVARYFESIGFKYVHQSAPPKGTTRDKYLQDQIDLVSSAAIQDIVLDRSYYGEACVWPIIYGRSPLLDEEGLDILREIEESVGTQRVWMTDDNISSHWQRCVDNKEPLDKAQFTKARGLYSSMAQKYNFEKATLQTFINQYPEMQTLSKSDVNSTEQSELNFISPHDTDSNVSDVEQEVSNKTPEQLKLEKANAINDILSKRILRVKGTIYDELEKDVRVFLNSKLGKLLGNQDSELSLTPAEIKFYKIMYKKALDKGDIR